MSQNRVVIFANGHIPDYERAAALLLPDDYFIAADGGSLHALAMQIRPHVVVGDLDSLPEEQVHHLTLQGTIFWRFPTEKDETDLELALRYALEAGYQRLLVVGALGGRLDQVLGNLSLLTNERFAPAEIRFDDGVEVAFFVRGAAEIHGAPGDTISLIPWGAPVTGIVTEGLKYRLTGETLHPTRTRGVSNVMLEPTVRVTVESGLLLCIHIRHEV